MQVQHTKYETLVEKIEQEPAYQLFDKLYLTNKAVRSKEDDVASGAIQYK